MCTAFLLLFRRKNKVAPVPLSVQPYRQRLISYAEREIERENALLRRHISTQTTASLTNLVENQRCGTPKWLTYDIDLDGNIVAEGFKRQHPRKLEKHPELPVLTLEMLLEKQNEAEKKQNQEIDSKREKAAIQNKAVNAKRERKQKKRESMAGKIAERERKVSQNRQELIEKRKEKARKSVEAAKPRNTAEEDAEKTSKVEKILQKQLRAEEKRKEQLELVKTKANKTAVAFNQRYEHKEAERLSKAQEKEQELQQRAVSANTKRDSVLREIVRKQEIRESYAKKLRARDAKQQKDEEEFIAEQLAGEIEVDPYYFESSASEEEDDDEFWQ